MSLMLAATLVLGGGPAPAQTEEPAITG